MRASRRLAALHKAERPLAVIGSQAVVQARQADALADAVARLGIPVYLSGMARGLLGPPPAADAPPAPPALRDADCVLLAGVPATSGSTTASTCAAARR